jgi:hypothetical protein
LKFICINKVGDRLKVRVLGKVDNRFTLTLKPLNKVTSNEKTPNNQHIENGLKKLLRKGSRKVVEDMRTKKAASNWDWEKHQNDEEDALGYDFRNIVEIRTSRNGELVTTPPIRRAGTQRMRKQLGECEMKSKTVYDDF